MNLLSKLMGQKIKGPEFIKDFDLENNQNLKQLYALLEVVGDDQKPLIEEQIKLMNIGMDGEKNVHYELKHCYLPMLCLHDIRLEYNDLTSQFDFILICRNFIMVLETKKLIGDIMIDSDGNFTRVFKDYKGTVYKKEGMYSPISQNQKHVDLLQRMLIDNKIIKRLPIYSLVVVANPKTIIDKRYASEEVKNAIVKYDQIKNELNKRMGENKEFNLLDKVMYDISKFIMDNNKPIEYDYIAMFNLKVKTEKQEEELIDDIEEIDEEKATGLDDGLYEKLRAYRYKVAKERKIFKLYYVFNNKELEQLVLLQPTTIEELLNVNGFGEKKCEDYGQDIINIIKDHQNQVDQKPIEPKDNSTNKLISNLKQYRYNKSVEEGVKPYIIFTNNQMDSICEKLPKTKDELLQIPGFGETKVLKYGNDLLAIIKKHQ